MGRGESRGGGRGGRGREQGSAPRGGAAPDPAFLPDPDPDPDPDLVKTDPKLSPVADPSASSPASPEKPVPAEVLSTDPKPISIIPSGVLSIDTDEHGVQTVKIMDETGEEHRYSLDLLKVLSGRNKEVPHQLVREIGEQRRVIGLRVGKLQGMNAPEAKVRPRLAELAMLNEIMAAVDATTPTLAESRAAAQAAVAAAREAAEVVAAEKAAVARTEAIQRAEQASEVQLGKYTIRLGIDNGPEAGPNTGKMVIKIVHTVDIDGQPTPETDLYALEPNTKGNVLNLPDDIFPLVQQARQSLFDRHVRALRAQADRLWGKPKGKTVGGVAQVHKQAPQQAPQQASEPVPTPADAEIIEAEAGVAGQVEAARVEEPVKLSRPELNQLHTLTEIAVAYINAVYQSEYAGGRAKGKKDMKDMPKDMWNTVKDLVSYFGSRHQLNVFLSPAELKQRQVLSPIYTEHTAQVKQAREEHHARLMAAEREYQRTQAQGAGREAKPRNIPRELQHAFHRPISSDALAIVQNPGGFLIKSVSGDMLAIQIDEAMSGRKNVWEVYVVSDGGSGYIREEQTFELVRKGGPQGHRLEMQGMTPVIAQGLETFVSVVGVDSLSQALKAFYDAHMQVKTEKEVQDTFKPRPPAPTKPVRTAR